MLHKNVDANMKIFNHYHTTSSFCDTSLSSSHRSLTNTFLVFFYLSFLISSWRVLISMLVFDGSLMTTDTDQLVPLCTMGVDCNLTEYIGLSYNTRHYIHYTLCFPLLQPPAHSSQGNTNLPSGLGACSMMVQQ